MAQGFMLHRRRKVSKAFKTTWNVTVGTLSIPSQDGTYNCTVDWGDGTAPTMHTTGALVHTYTTAGLCQISITGQYSGFMINGGADKDKLISIDDWGTVGFTSMNSAFNGCVNLASLTRGAITGAKNATSFVYCFSGCNSLATIPKGLFDNVPNATSFFGCFAYCNSLLSIPDGLFDDVPNVTAFNACFRDCYSLSEVPDGLFTSCPNVTAFNACFANCSFDLPTTMFNYTALAAKRPNMQNCFAKYADKDMRLTGTAYPLWNYINATSRNYCYQSQTALTNYADIPDNWK